MNWSALVQVVACRLIDTRPLPNLNQCCLIVNRILRNKPKWGGGDHIIHDDVIKWKHFARYWPFLRGIHRSPVERPVTRGLVFSLICAWTNGWANSRNGGDLRHHCAHYDVTVIISGNPMLQLIALVLEGHLLYQSHKRELSWCQLCPHWWHRRLSLWQPTVPLVTATLASWRPGF